MMRILSQCQRRISVRRGLIQGLLLLLSSLMFFPFAGYTGDEATVAIVPFDLIDTSLQGLNVQVQNVDKAELKRLQKTVAQLSRQIDKSKLFKVVENKAAAQVARELQQQVAYLHRCNGCEMRIGKLLNADYVLVGWVQKVSNLILNMNIVLRKVPRGEDIIGASADMRGNTDESWSRAATFLVEQRLFPQFAEL